MYKIRVVCIQCMVGFYVCVCDMDANVFKALFDMLSNGNINRAKEDARRTTTRKIINWMKEYDKDDGIEYFHCSK